MRHLFVLLLVVTTGCGSAPPCEDVALSALAVDAASTPPEISWEGRAADLTVASVETDDLAWEVRCNCMDEERRPDANSGCADSEAEFEYRTCLAGSLTYGTLPDLETIATRDEFDRTKSDADALISGEEYEVRATAYCDGGSEPDAANFVEQMVTFLAP